MSLIPPTAVQLTGKNSLRQFLIGGWTVPNPIPKGGYFHLGGLISTTPQAAVADALVSTGGVWTLASSYAHLGGRHGSPPSDEQSAQHTISTNYYQPYSIAYCLPDSIAGPNDDRPIAFPISAAPDYTFAPYGLENVNYSIADVAPAIQYPSITRAQLFELPGSNTDNRVKWVELPQSAYNSITIGVIILQPTNVEDIALGSYNTNQDYVTCSLGAGWGASSVNAT